MKTKEDFDNFVKELIYHHRGPGVKEHGTRSPVFVVHRTERIYGFECTDNSGYLSNGDYVFYASLQECIDSRDDSEIPDLIKNFNNENNSNISTVEEWIHLDKDEDVSDAIQTVFDCELTYYKDQDLIVNEHLTLSAAEDYVRRNKYNYSDLRISVESFNDRKMMEEFVDLIMDGKIVFKE